MIANQLPPKLLGNHQQKDNQRDIQLLNITTFTDLNCDYDHGYDNDVFFKIVVNMFFEKWITVIVDINIYII